MTQEITQFLLEHFPDRGMLSYEDFTRAREGELSCMNDAITCVAYDYDNELGERAFRIISRPWPEIDWFEIGSGGWMVPMFLNRKSFIHAFPSLLNYLHLLTQVYPREFDKNGELSFNFIDTLDLNEQKRREDEVRGEGAFDWRRAFYFSLPEEVKKIIGLILRMDWGGRNALESYWGMFGKVQATPKRTRLTTSSGWVAPDFTVGGFNLAFRRIEAGRFTMGSYPGKEDIYFFETPPHTVRITRPFYLGQFPVTQAQWLRVMGKNPSYFVGNDDHPVDCVSWDEAQTFITKLNTPLWWDDKRGAYRELRRLIARLNEEAGLTEETGYVFRLPTEAEWEYACRAVSGDDPERETKERWHWFFGDDPAGLEHYGWYSKNAGIRTHPVGEKRPNPWGLYDLYGNVWEWVWDELGDYPDEETTDPTRGIRRRSGHVQRGGNWYSPDWRARSAYRSIDRGNDFTTGFRLTLAPRLPSGQRPGNAADHRLQPAGSLPAR